MPPPIVQGRALHGAAEARQEEGKEAQWESGPSLTGGRRRDPSARQMGEMTAGGVAMQHLSQEALPGGDRRERAGAPCSRPDLTADREDGFGLQPHGPLAGEALQDRSQVRNQLMPSWMIYDNGIDT
jgi:hypothetical protein